MERQADALGAPELALDPRFITNDLRCRNRPDMVAAIEALTGTEPVEHWIEDITRPLSSKPPNSRSIHGRPSGLSITSMIERS